MKSIADKPPLARLAYLSVTKVTLPRKRRDWSGLWLWCLCSLGLWALVVGTIWSVAG